MRKSTLLVFTALVVAGTASAQNSGAQASASAQSQTTVSADHSGASASHQSNASGGAATQGSSATVAKGTELDATLSHPVDSRKARPGDEVTATLAHDTAASDGVRLHRGTKLVGHVTEARPHDRHADKGSGDSRLGFVFDKAVLPDGREIAVNAAIQAVAVARAATEEGAGEFDSAAGAAGGARSSAGGIGGGGGGGLGGAGALGGSATHAVGGGFGTVGGAGAGISHGATSTLGGAAGASHGAVAGSRDAVGGLNTAGQLSSGSRGVFGMRDVELARDGSAGAYGSVLTSSAGNVELGKGTQLVLSAGGGAAGAARATGTSAEAAGAASSRAGAQTN